MNGIVCIAPTIKNYIFSPQEVQEDHFNTGLILSRAGSQKEEHFIIWFAGSQEPLRRITLNNKTICTVDLKQQMMSVFSYWVAQNIYNRTVTSHSKKKTKNMSNATFQVLVC